MSQNISSSESRALALLGQGINPEMTASAVGLSVSRISQLLSDPDFANQVADLRYKNLVKHNQRDATYDEMEDILAKKFHDLIPFMMKPMEILKALREINALKRRGSSAPDSITQQQEVIQLVMPVQIINQYRVNSANQVIQAGQQELITVQSSRLGQLALESAARTAAAQRKELPNVVYDSLPNASSPESSAASSR